MDRIFLIIPMARVSATREVRVATRDDAERLAGEQP
jgi:hypothetical protein